MKFNKKLLAATLLTAGGFAAISSANAADSDTFTVSTTVDASCSVDATNADVAFGTIAANTAAGATTITNQRSTASGIAVTCSNGAPYLIKLTPLSAGLNTDGTGIMAGSTGNTATIAYKLSSDNTGTAWGSVDANDVAGTGLGLSTPVSHLVYASITGSTDVKEDTYTDTITAAITY